MDFSGLQLAAVLIASGLAVQPIMAQNPQSPMTSGVSVHFDEQSKIFRIDAARVTYAVGVNERGELQAIYWGERLQPGDGFDGFNSGQSGTVHSDRGRSSQDISESTTPQEFGGWGAGLYMEPALKITFPDGNRDLVLHYVSHKIDADKLSITLKDIQRDVFVYLTYTVDAETGIIGRSAVIENKTDASLVIEQASSANWTLPRGEGYSLRYLTGRWAAEFQLQTVPVHAGQTVLESRRGSTSHQNNPWFAIKHGDFGEDEDSGEVWFGALAWSGSWRITIEQDQVQQVRITGGFNPFDFGYKLNPGEKLETPVFYAGHTDGGIGEASRLEHRFQLHEILPGAPSPKPRPVLYNSWEATGFSVDEAGQSALAKKAASIGVERFVMDDGWFGHRGDDHAGLGDWNVNPKKFPHGLKPLIGKVHSLGMDFGLWVEPEMVNPDSDLYRQHPDWVLNFTGRPRTEARNQLVLNLARPDVREYVFNFLDKLLGEYDIAFLKWDYNRSWSEPGWPAVAPDEQKKVYVEFTRNFYSIVDELRAKHPHVEIESCSGGGGRVDLGIMHRTEQVWVSDNTDAFDRLFIQSGFTYAYTPGVMMAWVTDSPSGINGRTTSVGYRFLSSMQGSLGIGANLKNWQPEDFAVATKMISYYKQVRETVQHGDLYRLRPAAEFDNFSAVESVSPDKKQAVVFAYLHSSRYGDEPPRLRLRGLQPDARYRLTWIESREHSGREGEPGPHEATGDYFMSRGIDVRLWGDFDAVSYTLDRVQ
jgi:alpha-galactosidase